MTRGSHSQRISACSCAYVLVPRICCRVTDHAIPLSTRACRENEERKEKARVIWKAAPATSMPKLHSAASYSTIFSGFPPIEVSIMFRYLFALALLIQLISGFTHTHKQHQRNGLSFRPANFVSAAAPTRAQMPFIALRMSSEDKEDSTAVESKIYADGTFYDDEVDSSPQKDGISDSMKARLAAEAASGLDSEKKQTNVILYICLGVAVLVVLGGAGIFY